MGTSSSYGGSRGAGWRRARSHARRLPEIPSNADIDGLVSDIAGAMGWGDAPGLGDEQAAPTGSDPPLTSPPAPPIGSWGPISARRAGGGGGGGGGASAGGAGRRAGGAGGGGGTRSRRAAARTASRAARIAYGVARGDAALLETVGLRLADFIGLTVAEQVQRIAEAAVGATIEEAELDKAITRMTVEILDSGGDIAPADAARRFVEAYTYEIMLTEVGGVLRDAGHGDAWSRSIERQIRDSIHAVVETYPLDAATGADQVGALIETVLEGAREVLATRGRR